MPKPQRLLAAAAAAALSMAAVSAVSAQSFYPTPNASRERRLALESEEASRRARIEVRKRQLAADAERRQLSVRPTDRDQIVVERRYGNAIPNRQGDTGSTTIQSTGNRSLLVPQR